MAEEVWTVERADTVMTCSFSPDGSRVLCGSGRMLSLLDAATGKGTGLFIQVQDYIRNLIKPCVPVRFYSTCGFQE